MDDKDQYILDLEKRLQEQEEVFEKELYELENDYIRDFHGVPLKFLCGYQPFPCKNSMAYALRVDSIHSSQVGLSIQCDNPLPRHFINVKRCQNNVYKLIMNNCESYEFKNLPDLVVLQSYRTIEEHIRTLYTCFLNCSNQIAQDTGRGAGNFIWCSIKWKPYISTMSDQYTEQSEDTATLGRFTIQYDPNSRSLGDFIIAYKGREENDAGLIFCPLLKEKDSPIEDTTLGAISQIGDWTGYYKVIRIV
jgi:hypothetical protein